MPGRTAASADGVAVGVDIGTTALKAVGYDRHGTLVDVASREYPLDSPRPDRAEQDPDVVLEAARDALREVAAAIRERGSHVEVVAFSAAMHSLLALDADGRPLTPASTFADHRARAQADHITAELDGPAIHRRTGTPIHPMSPLTKLRWFRDEQPDLLTSAAHWVSIKEYVLAQLFGELVVDLSIASATGLLDLESRDWDDQALEVAGVRREALSPIVATTHELDPGRERLTDLGLDEDTRIVVGASDGVLANIGVGAVGDRVAACSIGTSGAVRVTTDRPHADPEGRTFCYALTEDHWVVGGAINHGGIVLRWVRDELFPDIAEDARAREVEPYEALVELAGEVGPGSGGLLLLPYLLGGERAPHWSGLPRGVLFGLRRQHTRAHIVRSVLEGVAFQLYSVVRSLAEADIHPEEFRATGGAVASPLWRQILADVFDARVTVPDREHGSSFGAALLGRYAIGTVTSLDISDDLTIAHEHLPVEEHTHLYHRLHPMFERLYERVEPEFAEHDALQTDLLLAEQETDETDH